MTHFIDFMEGGAVARAELIKMEDERDAALLEVERLKLEILALEHTVHHLLEQRDNAILRAERMEEAERGDAQLDVRAQRGLTTASAVEGP